MSGPPTVSIVIASWNGRQLLEPCLASIAALDYPGSALEVLVVDNGSTDETVAWLARTHPAVRVVKNADNRGFAAASNQGAEAASGEVVAFVNNDVRLDPAWLRPLSEALADDDVAAAGSRMLDWEGRRFDFDGGAMSFHGHGVSVRHGHPYAPGAHGTPETPVPTLFACGGAMAVVRGAFLAAGGFDADYFAYFEDVDLGWRLWVRGQRVVHVPRSIAYHRHHGSGMGVDRRTRLLERNALASLVKNYDDSNLAIVEPAAVALLTARAETAATGASGVAATVYEDTLAEFEAERATLDGKRAQVQAGRRRSDEAILPLFVEPFRPCMFGREYFQMQQEIVRKHGVGTLFGGDTAGLETFVDELQWRVGELEGELATARAEARAAARMEVPVGPTPEASVWQRLLGRWT